MDRIIDIQQRSTATSTGLSWLKHIGNLFLAAQRTAQIVPLQYFRDRLGQCILAHNTGRDLWIIELALADPVESGHDHILRHIVSKLHQTVAYRNRHRVIQTDDRIRQTLARRKDLIKRRKCWCIIKITILEIIVLQRHIVLSKHFSDHRNTAVRAFMLPLSRNAGYVLYSVFRHQMIHQRRKCLALVVDDINAAGRLLVIPDHNDRFVMHLRLDHHVLDIVLVVDHPVIDDQCVYIPIVNQLIYCSLSLIKRRTLIQVCSTEINRQLPADRFQTAAQRVNDILYILGTDL